MKRIILVFLYLFVTFHTIYAQYLGLPYYSFHQDPVYFIDDPKLTYQDSIILSDCADYSDSSYYNCVFDIDLIRHYTDSSKSYYYHKEKGQALLGKKYGKWYVENGYYKDSLRFRGNRWNEYYINDYIIPFAEYVSDSIYYDFEKRKATCIMTHFGSPNFPNTKVRLEYFSSNNFDTTYVECTTLDNHKIFKTTTDYVKEEIKLMIDGYYNRKIYLH